jgi:hypothetical protein
VTKVGRSAVRFSLACKAVSGSGLSVDFRSYRAHLIRFVTTGLDPMDHAEVRQTQQVPLRQ